MIPASNWQISEHSNLSNFKKYLNLRQQRWTKASVNDCELYYRYVQVRIYHILLINITYQLIFIHYKIGMLLFTHLNSIENILNLFWVLSTFNVPLLQIFFCLWKFCWSSLNLKWFFLMLSLFKVVSFKLILFKEI